MKTPVARMNTKQARAAERCIRVILRSDRLDAHQRAFLKAIRLRIKRERGFRPSGSEMVLLEAYISRFLSPAQVEYLRLHNVGSRAAWVARFGEEVKAV